jgi:hypothetical protein
LSEQIHPHTLTLKTHKIVASKFIFQQTLQVSQNKCLAQRKNDHPSESSYLPLATVPTVISYFHQTQLSCRRRSGIGESTVVAQISVATALGNHHAIRIADKTEID